jgi:hypothetical protein
LSSSGLADAVLCTTYCATRKQRRVKRLQFNKKDRRVAGLLDAMTPIACETVHSRSAGARQNGDVMQEISNTHRIRHDVSSSQSTSRLPSRPRLSGLSAETSQHLSTPLPSGSRWSARLIGCGAQVSAQGSAGTGAHVLHRRGADNVAWLASISCHLSTHNHRDVARMIKPYTLCARERTDVHQGVKRYVVSLQSTYGSRRSMKQVCVHVSLVDCGVSAG